MKHSGHEFTSRRRGMVAAAAMLATALIPAASMAARIAPRATPFRARVGAAKPPIKPARGKPFVPALGDWEGKVNGFPASFELRYQPTFRSLYGLPPYGYKDMVLLKPNRCPPSAGRYAEELLSGGGTTPIRAGGGFGLKRYGFSGALTGARSAALSNRVRIASGGGCATKLSWRMHPAKRRPVLDGTWTLRFSDGETGTFRVQSGGRLAISIGLPAELAKCGGPFGAVDLFIGPDGQARISQTKLRVSIDFSRRRATGEITVPGGCAGRHFPLTASI